MDALVPGHLVEAASVVPDVGHSGDLAAAGRDCRSAKVHGFLSASGGAVDPDAVALLERLLRVALLQAGLTAVAVSGEVLALRLFAAEQKSVAVVVPAVAQWASPQELALPEPQELKASAALEEVESAQQQAGLPQQGPSKSVQERLPSQPVVPLAQLALAVAQLVSARRELPEGWQGPPVRPACAMPLSPPRLSRLYLLLLLPRRQLRPGLGLKSTRELSPPHRPGSNLSAFFSPTLQTPARGR